MTNPIPLPTPPGQPDQPTGNIQIPPVTLSPAKSVGSPKPPADQPAPPPRLLSTAERQETLADPNVREIMDIFKGDLIDIVKDPAMPDADLSSDDNELPQDES